MAMNVSQKIILLCIFLGILFLTYSYLAEKGYIKTSDTKQSTQSSVTTRTSTKSSPLGGVYTVSHVVDGDTVDAQDANGTIRIRLLGVNTPESVDPRRPNECYGKEASAYVKSVLQNRQVSIALDPQKPTMDDYGRVLAYVFRDDGLFVNKDLITKGFGYEYTYHKEVYKYQQDFKQAQSVAQKGGAGLWSANTCAGKK